MKKYIKYIIYGIVALAVLIFVISAIFATKNRNKTASDSISSGYKQITDVNGIAFQINKTFVDQATAILEISNGTNLSQDTFYVYKDGSDKYMLFNTNKLIVTAQKGTNFNFDAAQDKESAIEQSNIMNVWFTKSYKKAKVKKNNDFYIAPVNAQVSFTTDIYGDFTGELATISDGQTEWSVFAGIPGTRFDKLPKDTQKSIEAIVESLCLYTKEEVADTDIYEVSLDNLDKVDSLSGEVQEIELNQDKKDINDIRTDIEETVNLSYFKNQTIVSGEESKKFDYYLCGISMGEKIEQDFDSDYEFTDITLISPQKFSEFVTSDVFANNVSTALNEGDYIIQIRQNVYEERPLVEESEEADSEGKEDNKKDNDKDKEDEDKSDKEASPEEDLYVADLIVTASVPKEIYEGELKSLVMHNTIYEATESEYDKALEDLKAFQEEKYAVSDTKEASSEDVIVVEDGEDMEVDEGKPTDANSDDALKDEDAKEDTKPVVDETETLSEETKEDNPALAQTDTENKSITFKKVEFENQSEDIAVDRNVISESNKKVVRRDRSKAYTSTLYSMLELGEKGVITETDISNSQTLNPIIEVTDLYIGQDAINLIKDYCSSPDSLYHYYDAPEGCTWQAIRYNLSYKGCISSPYINIKFKGLDGTPLKYRGITYSPLTHDIFFKKKQSGDWIKDCYCFYAVPNGCEDYVIECGTGNVDKPEWGSYMQAAYYYIKLR